MISVTSAFEPTRGQEGGIWGGKGKKRGRNDECSLCLGDVPPRKKGSVFVLLSFTREGVEGFPVPSGFLFLLDEESTVYKAYGLTRGSLMQVYSAKTLLWYALNDPLMRNNKSAGGGDTRQLGGDFIVHKDGTLLFEHRSREPVDRPLVDTMVAALKK